MDVANMSLDKKVQEFINKLSIDEKVSNPNWEWSTTLLTGSRFRKSDNTILVDQFFVHTWEKAVQYRKSIWPLISYEIAHAFSHYLMKEEGHFIPPHFERRRLIEPEFERKAQRFAKRKTGMTISQYRLVESKLYPKILSVELLIKELMKLAPDAVTKLRAHLAIH